MKRERDERDETTPAPQPSEKTKRSKRVSDPRTNRPSSPESEPSFRSGRKAISSQDGATEADAIVRNRNAKARSRSTTGETDVTIKEEWLDQEDAATKKARLLRQLKLSTQARIANTATDVPELYDFYTRDREAYLAAVGSTSRGATLRLSQLCSMTAALFRMQKNE